jgi:O-antigen ligase
MISLGSKWIDYTILTCCFLLIIHNMDAPLGYVNPLSIEAYAASSGGLNKQVGAILLFAYGIFALFESRHRGPEITLSMPIVLLGAFFLFATLSLGWSSDLRVSAGRWFGFATYTLAGAGAVRRLGSKDLVRWYVIAHCSYLFLGFFNEIRLGTFHPLATSYRYAGINDDNSTGNEAAVLAFSSIAMLRNCSRVRFYRATLLLALVVLLLTRSRTALMSTIFALLLVYGVLSLRGIKLFIYLYGLAILVSLPFVLSSLGALDISNSLSMGRKDASHDTLTGRIPLWSELLTGYVDRRPIVGYGYGAFWTRERIEDISNDQGWSIAAAHSIYVDSVLAVGYCGGILYFSLLLSLFVLSLRIARTNRQDGFFFACVVCAVLLDGFSDSGPWYVASIYLFAPIQACFSLSSRQNPVSKSKGSPARRIFLTPLPQSMAPDD